MKTLYTAEVLVTGGRDGEAHSEDGSFAVTLVPPAELGGDGRPGTNPEELFAAGYGACFQTAMRVVAEKRKLELGDTSVRSTVRLDLDDAGSFGIGVTLDVSVAGLSQDDAEDLVRTVHEEVCPYSKAIRGNVPVEINVHPVGAAMS
jgi:lipoyl-dependent peroxiredoxin